MIRINGKKVIFCLFIIVIMSFLSLSTALASNQYYETVKNNVPVWSEASSKSKKVSTLTKAGTRVTIVSIAKNSAGNDWGRTDKDTYIFMENLKPYVYRVTFKNAKSVNVWYETVKSNVPVWKGPSTYSARNGTLASKGTRVKIVEIGINESNNEWGKTDEGRYIFMGNLKPYVYNVTFKNTRSVNRWYETTKSGVPVWNGPSSYAIQDKPLPDKSTPIKIVEIGINESNNEWGKTDKGKYIFMGNLQPLGPSVGEMVTSFPDKYYENYVSNDYQCVSYVYSRLREKFNFVGPEKGIGVGFGINAAKDGVKQAKILLNGEPYIERTWSNGVTTIVRVFSNDNGANIKPDSWVSFKYSDPEHAGHIVYVEDVKTINGNKYVYYSEGGAGHRRQKTDGVMREKTLNDFLNQFGSGNYEGTITFF